MMIFRSLALLALAACCLALPTRAQAAQSYDSCAGFIDSVPATITTQGVWCLRKDLATNITSGSAINIATNNVTLDCNDFKLGGLAAGNSSNARGISAVSRQNSTVRRCNVRGFDHGIHLEGGAGHLVEDNRLDNNLAIGIYAVGDNHRIRRNAVYDTGGRVGNHKTYGIIADGDISDNVVSGLFVYNANYSTLNGILAEASGSQVRNNMVSGFDLFPVQGGTVGRAVGIELRGRRPRASGNHVVGAGSVNDSTSSYGIWAYDGLSYCLDNTVGGFVDNIEANCITSGNLTSP